MRYQINKTKFLNEHEFLGQTILDRDVLPATIAMGLIK